MLVSSTLPGQILSITRVHFSDACSIPFPPSSCYQLLFLNRGNGEMQAQRQQFPIKGGEVCFFKPHRAFTLSVSEPSSELFLLRCDGSLPAFFQEILYPRRPHSIPVSKPSELCCQLEELYFYIKKSGVDGAVRASHTLSTVLTGIYTACNPETPAHAPFWLDSLLKEWELAPETIYSIPLLAERYGISEATLYRTFKKYTGLSPQQHLQQLRLSRARLLLTTTGLQIKYVAHAVGFYSVSRFIELFRRTYGETPAKYRKQHRRYSE